MPVGDKKSRRIRYSGGGGGGGGGRAASWASMQRDADRAKRSRSAYWYRRFTNSGMTALDWINSLDCTDLADMYEETTKITRHNKYDWDRITETLNTAQLADVKRRTADCTEVREDRIWMNRLGRELLYTHWRVERETAEAKRIEDQQARNLDMLNDANLLAGMVKPDVDLLFKTKAIRDQDEGDEIDSVVDIKLGRGGWAEDRSEAVGTRLQITMSLDMSNSNWHNEINGTPVAEHSIEAFKRVWFAIKELQFDNPGNITFAGFKFAMGRNGDRVSRIDINEDEATAENLNELDFLEDSSKMPYYAGEDTRFAPLLNRIAKWEEAEGDPAALRLDLVFTDGVFEYKKDYSKCNDIQAKRNGWLQTVFVNFLPEDDVQSLSAPTNSLSYPANIKAVNNMVIDILNYAITYAM